MSDTAVWIAAEIDALMSGPVTVTFVDCMLR